MRLIDADTLVDRFVPKQSYFTEDIKIKIETAQAVDAVPVKHGKWFDAMVGELPVQVCDQCNTFFPLAYTGGGHHYCPNCGAKMDLEE